MKRSLPVLLATLALIAGACGDDDDSSSDSVADTTANTPVATDAPPATDAPAPTEAPVATEAPAPTEPPATEPAGTEPDNSDDSADGEELSLATTDLGEVIVDDEGLTLYLFTPDAQGDTSQCTDACAEAWPPVTAVQSVEDGLDEALVGSITRADGTTQGTYNGWPLYYFSGDGAPADVNGQGLNGVWWVIDASGNAIGA